MINTVLYFCTITLSLTFSNLESDHTSISTLTMTTSKLWYDTLVSHMRLMGGTCGQKISRDTGQQFLNAFFLVCRFTCLWYVLFLIYFIVGSFHVCVLAGKGFHISCNVYVDVVVIAINICLIRLWLIGKCICLLFA